MANIPKRKSKSNDKINMTLDIPTLNAMIKYVQCEYVSLNYKSNLNKLLQYLDIETNKVNPDIYNRLKLLELMLDTIVTNNVVSSDIIQMKINESGDPNIVELSVNLGIGKNKLSQSECDVMTKMINERLQTIAIYKTKDNLIRLLENIDGTSYETSYTSLINELKDVMSSLLMDLHNSNASQGLLRQFSFSDDDYANLLGTVVNKAKKPSSILQTGIRQLNAILSPGFKSGRFYVILGGTGKFKSGTLLNITDQIRRYNPQIIPYENGRRKCILFITMENSIEETVERLYDMYSDVEDEMRDKTIKDVYNTLKESGKFEFDADSGIDIEMRYYGNLEINTSEIYNIVRSLNDKGKEPIAIVLDYIKRIDSIHPSNGDERVRIGYVSKELKNIAQDLQIPVISAMQLNRDGNGIIDAASRDGKEDVARFVGTSSIGNSWEIAEDADWICLINLEKQKSSGQTYLTFKRLKIRGKSDRTAVDYFNHPFTNEKNIRLEVDIDKEKPVSIISIASDLESIEEKNNELDGENKHHRITPKDLKAQQISQVINSIPLNSMLPKGV